MLAFYLRISKADRETEESNSIQSQRELLQQSLKQYGLLKEEIAEYIDDGYSGKNFERPGIKQLFSDIENGKIQVILVKDFSRFGRNHLEVSSYLEKKFPEKGIRFIAVNNRYDNDPKTVLSTRTGENKPNYFQRKREYEESGSSVFQQILDDYYSEESSCKIKQALLRRKKAGMYLVPVAPYGYKKEKKQGHFVIDQEAAEVVKLIFQMRCEGKSGAQIARYLNQKKIPSPLDYKNGRKGEHIWQSEVIWSILRNREYLGNFVTGKSETIQTGSRKRRKLPSDQWLETEAAHPAIIEKEVFEYVQITGDNLIKTERKKTEIPFNFNLKGIVICGGCGHKMKRKGG